MHYIPPKSLILQGNCLAFLTLEQLIQRQDVEAYFTLAPETNCCHFVNLQRVRQLIKHTEPLKMSEIKRLHFF